MNIKSVYFRVIRGEFLFTTDCTEITEILTDLNSDENKQTH